MNITTLMIAGLPGKMAREVVLAFLENPVEGVQLLPQAMSGTRKEDFMVQSQSFQLLTRSDFSSVTLPENTFAIDFTQPDAALGNIEFYTTRNIPFVMGTTGFDGKKAAELVEQSNLSAVIAPNMAIPIILLQSALASVAREFSGALTGYGFQCRESHQQGKKDTSGTAKALLRDFAALALPAREEDIAMERDPAKQRDSWMVPEEHLGGHAYHFYDITSPDGSVDVGLSHCVRGRRVYAEGALTALRFLQSKHAAGIKGSVYTMEDVLRGIG